VNTRTDVETVALWRPTGPEELALVEASGWRQWPPDQPIFYPRSWTTGASSTRRSRTYGPKNVKTFETIYRHRLRPVRVAQPNLMNSIWGSAA
jgi:hypothetical protein